MSKQTERSIVGELVLSLAGQGFRVEVCIEDGGGLYLYAAPYAGEKPTDGWAYWVRLVEGNGAYIISDYSVNLEPYIKSALELCDLMEKIEGGAS